MSVPARYLLTLLCLLTAAGGCADTEQQAQAALAWLRHRLAQSPPPAVSPPAPAQPTPPTEQPRQVATDTPHAAAGSFLDAIRYGDEQHARSLLTSAAQVTVREHNTSIRFPGSPAAVHHVGQVEFPEQADTAHIWCTWCDRQTNSRQAVQLVLIARQELPGWRIAGLVFLDENGQFGDIVDFEAPPRLAQSP